MGVYRFCRINSTLIEFAVLISLLVYLLSTLTNLKPRTHPKFGRRKDDYSFEGEVEGGVLPAPISVDEENDNLRTQFGDRSLEESIKLSRDHILSHVYKLNLNEDVEVKESYNVLRHTGIIYALSAINEVFFSPEITSAILKTAQWLKNRIAPLSETYHQLYAIWSTQPEIEQGKPDCAKLDAVGLGLVALIKAAQIDSQFIDTDTLVRIGEFIKFMQKIDGSFYSRWDKEFGFSDSNSLYYPGEACLGLMLLYEYTGDQKWFDVALKAMRFLALSRENERVGNVLRDDPWALIATREMLKSTLLDQQDKQMLIKYAKKVSAKLISEQKVNTTSDEIVGSFDEFGRVLPTCTKVEGLVAILPEFKYEQRLSETKKTVELGINFISSNQESFGPHKGGFRWQAKSGAERDMEIGMDLVQHCVTALVKYYQLIAEWINIE